MQTDDNLQIHYERDAAVHVQGRLNGCDVLMYIGYFCPSMPAQDLVYTHCALVAACLSIVSIFVIIMMPSWVNTGAAGAGVTYPAGA